MAEEIRFEAWPKIARLNREMVITEKIDGTNAAVIITDDGQVAAQSRSRLITPQDDNYGFARWVESHQDALRTTLGPGRHFGEWWGSGIQRKYGLSGGDKRLSLFNTTRWTETDLSSVPGLGVVPVITAGRFSTAKVESALNYLREFGSLAAPGFADPEGVVVYLTAARTSFKVTIKGDDAPKSLAA